MKIRIDRAALPASSFTLIPSAYTRDQRLSLEARGLLAWLMSMTADGEVTEDDIIAAGPDGRDVVRRMIGELEEHGYLRCSGTACVLTAPTSSEDRA